MFVNKMMISLLSPLSSLPKYVKIYVGIILFTGQFVSAKTYTCSEVFSAQAETTHWQSEYINLRQEIKNGENFVEKYSTNSNDILDYLGPIGGFGDKGSNPGGVFLIQTREGLKTLKVLPRNWDERIDWSSGMTNLQRDEVIIQQFFAKHNLAVPVRGLLKNPETMKLFERYPQMKAAIRHFENYRNSQWTAYVMDYIPDAWNPKQLGKSYEISQPPEHFKYWNLESLRRQLERIAQVRDILNIHLRDPQILITREGQVYAIDFGLETLRYREDISGAHFTQSQETTSTMNTFMNFINLLQKKLKTAVN